MKLNFNELISLLLSMLFIISCSNKETPLVVNITNPKDGTSVELFTVVPITFESNVEFKAHCYIDGELIYLNHLFSSSSFNWSTSNFSTGSHIIKVLVEEEDGRTASDEIAITINPSSTFETGAVTDIDNNNYNTVKIGEQWWMAENLRTTRYNDGVLLPTKENNWLWSFLEQGAYCWLDNDAETHAKQYGALYNWYAVITDKLCPDGWHVPSKGEVEQLITGLGTIETVGIKLKTPGFWSSSQTATNESGFSALQSGYRTDSEEGFNTASAKWWIHQTGNSFDFHTTWELEYNTSNVQWEDCSSGTGCSVRCVKD